MGLVTEYPVWFIIFCLAAGFLYSFFLYSRDSHFKELAPWKIKLMTAFRFASTSIISFLLLSPFVKTTSQYIEKPVIVIAQDNSESILLNKDSAQYKKELSENISSLKEKLGDKYEVKTYLFADKVTPGLQPDYKGKQTNLTQMINEVKNQLFNKNIGALIVATDGIYNQGANPLYQLGDVKFPVYPVALGDTSIQKDAVISKVNFNKIAFLGNKFPIQIISDFKKLKGASTLLRITHNGQVIFSKPMNAVTENYNETNMPEISADKPGLQRYNIELIPVSGEISTTNNYKQIVIDVIDSKQKILILANSIHPDIAAIKRALETNANYQVNYFTADKFTGMVQDYNLIILHQLPSKINSLSKPLNDAIANGVPMLYILGNQTALDNLNKLNLGLQIRQNKTAFDESQATVNKQFTLFQLSDELTDLVQKAPPLSCPFGDYKYNENAQVVFSQRISNINTSRPLMLFISQGDNRTGIITGEGIWRWRIHNYITHSNQEIFDEFINKVVNFLALKLKKENFNLSTKRIVTENEQVEFDAEIYNEAFELITTPEITLDITDKTGKKYNYSFEKNTNNYSLNAGIFPPGDYTYSAQAKINGKINTKQGQFSVAAINTEGERTIADHKLLNQLSYTTKGKTFYPNQFDELYKTIESNPDIVPVSFTEKKLSELVNFKLLFAFILVLLTAEWFFRKFFGSY